MNLQVEGNRFVVLGEIAHGGMGIVYRGFDRDLKREVAIKVLADGANSSAAIRFNREAQISGQLQHPGIVPVHQHGRLQDGRHYIAMKLVKGQTLLELIDGLGDENVNSRVYEIFGQICSTMAYSHSRNIVHRDLKPENVMVGEFNEVQIMDWGLAKKLENDGPRREPTGPTDKVEGRHVPVETVVGQVPGATLELSLIHI